MVWSDDVECIPPPLEAIKRKADEADIDNINHDFKPLSLGAGKYPQNQQ